MEKCDLHGINYIVEKQIYRKNGVVFHKFFFKDLYWNLLSYISFNLKWEVIYIIDITNWNWYNHMVDETKDIYKRNWFNHKSYKGFCETSFSYVLDFIKTNYPQINIIPVNSYEAGKNHVLNLIGRVKSKTWQLIDKVTWWGEHTIATIFLHN